MNPILQAIRILRAGGLVAFPTETVYGLGADAANAQAVRRIFAAKGRPMTNPLIAHVADAPTARRYAAQWPPQADLLADRYWPGPLTLVMRKTPGIVPEATAGRDTIGLRCPDHPLALEMLCGFGGPVVAPSANRSTHISATTAGHVREELGDAVDLILDGGPCRVGIESTVLDLSGPVPIILRPGSVTREQIEREIGPVELFEGSADPSRAAASPGQHATHYAPRAAAYRFSRDQAEAVVRWCADPAYGGCGLMVIGQMPPALRATAFQSLLEAPSMPEDYARVLYAALRQLDAPRISTILVEMPPDEPAWAAVRDRITRATKPIPDDSPPGQ